MLTLSRKPGETIRIGDDVLIVIRKATRGRVVVGVDAPQDVVVLRGELADASGTLSPSARATARTDRNKPAC